MMDQLKNAVAQLAAVDRLRAIVGQALTTNQQMAVSVKVGQDPEAFARFVQSDEGRAAVRVLADAFINSNPQ